MIKYLALLAPFIWPTFCLAEPIFETSRFSVDRREKHENMIISVNYGERGFMYGRLDRRATLKTLSIKVDGKVVPLMNMAINHSYQPFGPANFEIRTIGYPLKKSQTIEIEVTLNVNAGKSVIDYSEKNIQKINPGDKLSIDSEEYTVQSANGNKILLKDNTPNKPPRALSLHFEDEAGKKIPYKFRWKENKSDSIINAQLVTTVNERIGTLTIDNLQSVSKWGTKIYRLNMTKIPFSQSYKVPI